LFFYYRKLLVAVLSSNRAVTPERARILKEKDSGLYTCQGIRQGMQGFLSSLVFTL
jgi:hypothetical protein